MAEREYPIQPVGVEYVCDACGQGTVELTGVMLASDPPQWPHKCNHCGHQVNLRDKYPTVRYRAAKGG